MNIDEATKLWIKRLSENCRDRVAIKCLHVLNIYETCNILHCPRINEAQLKQVLEFKDLKKKVV